MSNHSLGVPKTQKHTRAEIVALIRHTLSVLTEPGQTVELRIPGVQGKRTDSGYFTDFDRLSVAAVAYENRAEGIYVSLNPVQPALLARSSNRVREYAKQTTSDRDVLHRRWVFVDFDPLRPAGISSSDEEHAAAIERATICREWLAQRGLPSILADSGNGAHLLLPIDWPNDDASTALIRDFLRLLDGRFSDDEVKVDTGTVGAGHLVKLYGTLARKGDCIPERPHRRSALLDVPSILLPIEAEAIRGLCALPAAAALRPHQHQTDRQDAAISPDRALLEEIKARFDMVAYAERLLGVRAVKDGYQFRLPGNAGFLVDADKGVWYRHGGQEGGDALDLAGYGLFGAAWNKRDAEMFRQALAEAAAFASVSLPRTRVNGPPSDSGEDVAAKRNGTAKLDLLDVAMAWQAKYGQDMAWDADRAAWRRWSGTHWQLERTSEMLDLQAAQMMRAVGVTVQSGSRTDGMLKYARGLCRRSFPPARQLVNFRNGTLDLATMRLRAHRRDDHLTRCLPYAYEADAAFPYIQRFLDGAIPDPDGRRAYMTHIGAALVGDVSLHKAVILFGPTRSGKTTLLKLAQLALGYKPGQFPTSTLFSSESRGANSRATWIDSNPNLVCLDEFPQDALRGEGEELFKTMTAHGGVSMWLKYQDERDENAWTAKLMFATNNRLHYRDQSGALTRRLLIVECPHSVPDARQDSSLLKRFEPELGMFATACIRLALLAQDKRLYPESASMHSLLSDIETNGDSIKLWLTENCVFEDGAFESTAVLYENYREWCDLNGVNCAGRPRMRDVIMTYRPSVVATRRRIVDAETGEVKLVWGLVGVRLRMPDDDLDDDATPTDPVDPGPESTPEPHEPRHDAICDGDPVYLQKDSEEGMDRSPLDEEVERVFLPDDRITGSSRHPPARAEGGGSDAQEAYSSGRPAYSRTQGASGRDQQGAAETRGSPG